MTTVRQRIEAFWAGERPDRIPYTIYEWEWQHTRNDSRWGPLFRDGLGVTFHFSPYSRRYTGDFQVHHENRQDGAATWRIQTLRTPVGELRQAWKNGWHHEYLLKTRDDYRIMTWIARHTETTPSTHGFEQTVGRARQALGEWFEPSAILLSSIGRTPLQTILVDYAGLEHFVYHLYDFPDAVEELYDALLADFARRVEAAAIGPGAFVSNLENFTAESLGPRLYARYLLPVYERYFPQLHRAGKIVGSHYDGRTGACKELIARAPIDLIESLTEPHEGDQTLAEARAAWPDKLFWCNIRVGDYQLPPDELTRKVQRHIRDGAVDGRLLAFEISEQYPDNWYDSVRTVLDAIARF